MPEPENVKSLHEIDQHELPESIQAGKESFRQIQEVIRTGRQITNVQIQFVMDSVEFSIQSKLKVYPEFAASMLCELEKKGEIPEKYQRIHGKLSKNPTIRALADLLSNGRSLPSPKKKHEEREQADPIAAVLQKFNTAPTESEEEKYSDAEYSTMLEGYAEEYDYANVSKLAKMLLQKNSNNAELLLSYGMAIVRIALGVNIREYPRTTQSEDLEIATDLFQRCKTLTENDEHSAHLFAEARKGMRMAFQRMNAIDKSV